jgi:NAD+ synthase (glutamine-hydrolysing)
MKTKSVKVAVSQPKSKLLDISYNIDKLSHIVENAKKEKAKVLLFPELAVSGYAVQENFTNCSLKISGNKFKKLLTMSKGIDLIIGFIEETEDADFFNSAAYLSE